MPDPIPDVPGIAGIILATAASCAIITATTGAWLPWVAGGLGIVVGLWAVKAINK